MSIETLFSEQWMAMAQWSSSVFGGDGICWIINDSYYRNVGDTKKRSSVCVSMSSVTWRHWTWGHLTWTLLMVCHAPHVIMSPPAWGMLTCQWPIRGSGWPIRGQWLEECQACIPDIISVPAIRDKTYFNKYPSLVNGDKKGFLKWEDGFGIYEKYWITMCRDWFVLLSLIFEKCFHSHSFSWEIINEVNKQLTKLVTQRLTLPRPGDTSQQPITVKHMLQ